MKIIVSAVGTLFLILAIAASASAATYTVGDSTGWMVPDATTFYSTWASSKTFRVGDKLVFNYTTGMHNVMKVRKTGYDACTAVSPLESYPSGPTTLTLNASGTHYYLCSVGPHCTLGQKVAIMVSASGSASSPPTKPVSPSPAKSASPPSTGSPSPSPPPPSEGSPPAPLSPAAAPNQKSSASSPNPGLAATTLALAISFAMAYVVRY